MAKMQPVAVKFSRMKLVESVTHAADEIRSAIVGGRFKPGDRLVEKQLSDQLGMSRHPVREALRRLQAEGFVDIRLNHGAVVGGLKKSTILEVYKLRSALGRLALRTLLQEGRPLKTRDLRRLRTLADNAVAFADLQDQELTIHNDLAFQTAIVEASGLTRTIGYFAELTAEVLRFYNLSKITFTERAEDARMVVRLLDAIHASDLSSAQAIWEQRFELAAQRFLAYLSSTDGAAAE